MTAIVPTQHGPALTRYLTESPKNQSPFNRSAENEEKTQDKAPRRHLSAADIQKKTEMLFNDNIVETTSLKQESMSPAANNRASALFNKVYSLYNQAESQLHDNYVNLEQHLKTCGRELFSSAKSEINDADSPPLSDREIAELIAAAMKDIESEYLEPFVDAFDKIQAFNALLSKFKSIFTNIFSVKDDDELQFDKLEFKKFLNEMMSAIKEYEGEKGELISGLGTEEEAKAWCEKFGSGTVTKAQDGSWSVRMDTSALSKIFESAKTSVNAQPGIFFGWNIEYDTIYLHMFNTANSAMNAAYESANTIANLFSNKLSNANATYQRVTEILSSFIAQALQTSQQFWRI